MFDDIVKQKTTKKRKINLRSSDITVAAELLEDVQEIMWDLVAEPCIYCSQEPGSEHEDNCKYVLVMEEIEYQLLKHRRS